MTAYKDKNLYDRIMARQTDLESIRQPWEDSCDKIIESFDPQLVKFADSSQRSTISILGAKIIEGTGPWAVRLMADGFVGNMVSRSFEWFRYAIGEQWLKGEDSVNNWLQALEEHMYSVYRKSTFYEALGPFCRSGIGVGSPVMIPEEDDRTAKIHHLVPHPAERYLMQNRLGVTDVLHLKTEWTIRNAVAEFGKDKFSESVQNRYDQGNDTEKITIIRGFAFYLDRIFEDLPKKEGLVEFRPHSPWVGYYVEKDAEGQEKELLRIKPYWSKPFCVWHYEKDLAEIYARTPAWFAYWDVNSMSAVRKSTIMAGQQQVQGPWWAPSYLKGIFKTYPKGINWFEPGQAQLKPERLNDKVDYRVSMELEDRMAKAVERWFHTRMWLLLQTWAEEKKEMPTATHIIHMMGEKAALLSPRVERYENDLLKPNDDRCLDIEQRAGRLPEPPDIVLEYSSGEIDPEWIGPLSQVQKQYHSTRRRLNALASAEAFFEIDPLTRHKLIAERSVERILEDNKFPQDEIRSDDEYKDLLNALAQKQMAEEGVQVGKEVADAVPKLSKKIEPGSPAAMLTEAVG